MRTFTNYLTLDERLTQVWINKNTLILLIAALKLIFFTQSLQKAIMASKTYVIANCDAADRALQTLTDNSPYYVYKLGNFLVTKSIESAVSTTLRVLSTLVYASQELLNFMVDLHLGTYVCLLVGAIDGTVDIATNTTEKLISFVNDTVITFTNELDDGLNDVSKVIDKVFQAGDKIEEFFTHKDNADDDQSGILERLSHVNLTIAALRHVQIPPSINEKLEELASRTPDFSEVKNATKRLLDEPFEFVRNEIDSMNTSNWFANVSLLYTPPYKHHVNVSGPGICSQHEDVISSVYRDIIDSLETLTICFLTVLSLGACMTLFYEIWRDYRFWKKLQRMKCDYTQGQKPYLVEYLDSQSSSSGTMCKLEYQGEDSMDIISVYYSVFESWHTRLSRWVVKVLTLGGTIPLTELQRGKLQWVVIYITSERALTVLGVGLLGVVVCGFQFLILHLLRVAVLSKTSPLNRLAWTVGSITEDRFGDYLDTWAKQVNLFINTTEDTMNERMFGWVDKITASINNTVNTAITDIDNVLNRMFNGTLLHSPMSTVARCAIEDKLYDVRHAMTWLENRAHIDLPRINITEAKRYLFSQTLPQSPKTSNLSSATSHEILQDVTNAVISTLDSFKAVTLRELYVSSGIIGIWILQIFIGCIISTLKG